MKVDLKKRIEQAKDVFRIEAEGLKAVADALDEAFVQAVDVIYACPSRLIVTGIGKSGLVGQKIVATLNSTGTPSFFLHPVEAMHGDLGLVSGSDVILALSYSGETQELNRLLASLKERQSTVIAITGEPTSTLARHADITLNAHIPQEACPLGLAPTTSTTATLAMGDALAVALLEKRQFQPEDFRKNHPGGSLGERLTVAVSEVMLSGDDLPQVQDDASLPMAMMELNAKNLGAVMVVNAQGILCGIVTDGDIRRLLAQGIALNTLTLEEVMTGDPVTIPLNTMAADALSLMQKHEITVLGVLGEDAQLQGVLHLHDLLGKGEFRFLI